MSGILDSLNDSRFMPHAHCYLWSPAMIALQVASDALIALAYLAIPLALVHFVRQRKDLAFSWMFVMFAAFILGCGATHVMSIVTVWKPLYFADGLVKLLTGVVSLATAALLWKLIPKAVALPSPEQLRAVNDELTAEIQERKMIEERLRQTQSELENRVQDRTQHLEAANARLAEEMTERLRAEEERREFESRALTSQKLESLGVLAGGVAHDFNNLLVGILGYASLAQEQLPASSPVQQSLQQIRTASHRAAELAHQMLAYSGRGRFVVEAVSLGDLIREMAALLEAAIPRNVSLRLHVAEDLPPVKADAVQIRQVLMNLLLNAADAMDKRGGTVSINVNAMHADREYLERTCQAPGTHEPLPEGEYIAVEVSDDGCGMDRETVARIFDPFFTTKFAGRGLGLAAVLGIVRGHGGAINVYSEPDKGTTFKLLFPAIAGTAKRKPLSQTKQMPLESIGGGGTVLIVDDEEHVRGFAQAALELAGYEVIVAADGEQGVEQLRLHPEVGVVLLDLTMPKVSGEGAYGRMHRMRPEVRVILSSGYSEAETTQRFAGKGLTGFLQKPYTARALVEAIRSALEGGAPIERPDR